MNHQVQDPRVDESECSQTMNQLRAETGSNHTHPPRENLLECWDADRDVENSDLPLVRIDRNELVLIPFTADTQRVQLHYCDEPEVGGYIACNGAGCVLCKLGRSKEERALLPVFLPTSECVGILPISPSSRPGALRPQIMPILRSGKRVAVLVRRPDRAAFAVSTADLADDVEDGAEFIERFQRRWDAGEIDLTAAYQRIDDRDLAEIPGIATLMRIKKVAI